jgi:AAA15 family ATPase/GTPase
MQEIVNLWSPLTELEDTIVSALKFLEPSIERIASLPNTIFWSPTARGGFVVKQSGIAQPIPIGSFGDGVWRMFSLAVALSRSQDSVLLIDEIDTGLHYSVMDEMWKFVDRVSALLNVQVFATTHSYDCIRSLSGICANRDCDSDITIQRIEAGKTDSIPFSAEQIKIAAARNLEIR